MEIFKKFCFVFLCLEFLSCFVNCQYLNQNMEDEDLSQQNYWSQAQETAQSSENDKKIQATVQQVKVLSKLILSLIGKLNHEFKVHKIINFKKLEVGKLQDLGIFHIKVHKVLKVPKIRFKKIKPKK